MKMRSLPGLWPELFGAEGKFGHAGQDQETAHEEFFVRVDGPNLTGNQIYCICRSRTRRRYKGAGNIVARYCSIPISIRRWIILEVRSD